MKAFEELVVAFYVERDRTKREPVGVVMTAGFRELIVNEQFGRPALPGEEWRPGETVRE